MEPLGKRLGRLVDRILQGGVIPFVGAGISRDARVPGSDLRPTVSFMAEALRRELECCLDAYCPQGPAEDDTHRPDPRNCCATPWPLSSPGHPQGPECATLRDLLASTPDNALSQLAEIGQLLWGANRVCEILRIAEFADLEPLPVHRYLAYLAREGLFTEIITTNYDGCIERAYRCSFGPDLQGLPEDLDGDTPAVIRDLEEYRAKANTLSMSPTGVLRPILRLYKINGCAVHYREARQNAERNPGMSSDEGLIQAAERIILTERQLQTFRSERWALDLFRDRARTRNLLFSGFGSEEPQVRHAALAITQEFQNRRGRLNPVDATALPNAPWVAAHQQLSFYQLQILAGYLHAHIGGSLGSHPLGSRVADLLGNVFLGPDAQALGAAEPKLSADLFLRAVFERTFCALLERELADGSLFANWLRTQVPDSWRTWITCLQNLATTPKPALQPRALQTDRAADTGPATQPETTPNPVPLCAALLEPMPGQAPLRLWTWLWAMRYPSQPTDPAPHWYLPLTEEPLLILVTLLLMCTILANSRAEVQHETGTAEAGAGADQPADLAEQVRPISQHGLAVDLPARAEHAALRVYLVAEVAPTATSQSPQPIGGDGDQQQRLLRRIAVPSSRFRSERLRVERAPSPGNTIGTLYVGRIETLGAATLVSLARLPENLLDALRKLTASQRTQPRVHMQRRMNTTG